MVHMVKSDIWIMESLGGKPCIRSAKLRSNDTQNGRLAASSDVEEDESWDFFWSL